MDAVQWPQQEMGLVVMPSPMVEMVSSASTQARAPPHHMEKRTRPQKEQALNCPRCNSTNTKFCYYNNYSLTQPRYFCKTCRRYWTEGGSLRNVPVGGGSRKNKRPTSSSSSSSSTSIPNSHPIINSVQNPKFHDVHDLNLSFPHHHYLAAAGNTNTNSTNSIDASTTTALTGISSRELNPFFVPMSIQEATGAVFQSGGGFPLMHDLSRSSPPAISFPVDGIGVGSTGYENMPQEGSTGGRMLLPFEDLRHMAASGAATEYNHDQNRGQGEDSSGFWSGVMGGGGAEW